MKNPWNEKDEYTPKHLMGGTGINTALYNQWLYRNIFTASNPAEGPGTTSSYAFSDILTVALIVRLRRADIRLKKASSIARDVVEGVAKWKKQHKGDDWPKVYVVFTEDGVRIDIDEDRNMEAVLRLDVFTIAMNIAGNIDNMKPE